MIFVAVVAPGTHGSGVAVAESGHGVALSVGGTDPAVALEAAGGYVAVALDADRAVPGVEQRTTGTLTAQGLADSRGAAQRIARARYKI